MSTSQIVWVTVGAALICWCVGAYNRLVRLRSAVVQRYTPIDEQVTRRHRLLRQQIDALEPVLLNAAPRLELLRAACRQIESACAHARQRPGAAGAVTSLRLAEGILGEARARLPVQSVAGVDLAALNAQIVESDTALGFARNRFNAAATDYNLAIAQFPTRLVAGLFGFHLAGLL